MHISIRVLRLMILLLRYINSVFQGRTQPPPQALRFSHGRGERETRVTGDEPQGTMGRVQTAGVSFPPSFARTSKRDVWVRGREGPTLQKGRTGFSNIDNKKYRYIPDYKISLASFRMCI